MSGDASKLRRTPTPDNGITPSRQRPRDLWSEALAGMLQRPARSVLTALGTVLGVGTFVAVLGLTATATGQIGDRFNALTATEITVEDTGGQDPRNTPLAFPPDADTRVRALNGVEHAGVYWTIRLQPDATVRAAPLGPDAAGQRIPVIAASPGVLEAAGARWASGRGYDAFHNDRAEAVAVIGEGMAERLGVTTLDTAPAVFIGNAPFTVIGILADTDRKADLLLSVLIPRATAEKMYGPPDPGQRAAMLATTRIGAARQVAGEIPYALRPETPEAFKPIPHPTRAHCATTSPTTSARCSCSSPGSA